MLSCLRSKFFWFLMAWIVAILVVDQWSKSYIYQNYHYQYRYNLIDNFLAITPMNNPGVAFGMFQRFGDILLYLIPALLVAILIYTWQMRKEHPLVLVCMASIFGGAVGNYIDRVTLGHVRDFVDVFIFNWDFPVFNFADACISVSVFFLLLLQFFRKPSEPTKT